MSVHIQDKAATAAIAQCRSLVHRPLPQTYSAVTLSYLTCLYTKQYLVCAE